MAVRHVVKDRILGGSYHNVEGYRNVIFSAILALYDYYEDFLFPGDPDRIVYASPEFAFRRRIQTQKLDPASNSLSINSLNMPFLAFSIGSGGINTNIDRVAWKNFPLELDGFMDWTINKKIRLSPIKIDFNAIYFTDRTLDMHYIMTQFLWDDALETKIYPKIEIDGVEFENMGLLSYNTNYGETYNEDEWLEKNKLQAITVDFSLDTFMIRDHNNRFAIPKSVIFNFAHKHGLEVGDYDITLNGVIDHVLGEVDF